MAQSKDSKVLRGLVLEGGGAKGAWQFGALQALADAGIKFDYVAGTSVGALNGALWAAGRLDLGKELWASLSTSKVFKLRPHHSLMFLIGLFARIFYAYVKGFISPSEIPLTLRRLLYGLMSVPTIVATIYLLFVPISVFSDTFSILSAVPTNIRIWIVLILEVSAVLLLIGFWVQIKKVGNQHFFHTSLLASAVLLIHLFYYVIGGPDSIVKRLDLIGLILKPALEMPIFLWFLGVIPFVIFCIAKLLRELNTSIFSVAPLEVIIKDLLTGGFKIPMFATVAREIHEYFDPDALEYRFDPEGSVSTAISRSTIMPSYLRVDSLHPEDALTALLATSALPLGITPRRKGRFAIDSQELNAVLEAEAEAFSKLILSRRLGKAPQASKVYLIDGGVVDNVPWYQFIEDVPCDEIVIVGCNPVPNWDDVERKREWILKNRLLRVVKLSLQYDYRKDDNVFVKKGVALSSSGKLKNIKNDPPIVVPFRKPYRWPKRVVIIAPDTPLGNFLTGTLNFSAKVARKRLAAGYQKASRIIEEEFHLSR